MPTPLYRLQIVFIVIMGLGYYFTIKPFGVRFRKPTRRVPRLRGDESTHGEAVDPLMKLFRQFCYMIISKRRVMAPQNAANPTVNASVSTWAAPKVVLRLF